MRTIGICPVFRFRRFSAPKASMRCTSLNASHFNFPLIFGTGIPKEAFHFAGHRKAILTARNSNHTIRADFFAGRMTFFPQTKIRHISDGRPQLGTDFAFFSLRSRCAALLQRPPAYSSHRFRRMENGTELCAAWQVLVPPPPIKFASRVSCLRNCSTCSGK